MMSFQETELIKLRIQKAETALISARSNPSKFVSLTQKNSRAVSPELSVEKNHTQTPLISINRRRLLKPNDTGNVNSLEDLQSPLDLKPTGRPQTGKNHRMVTSKMFLPMQLPVSKGTGENSFVNT